VAGVQGVKDGSSKKKVNLEKRDPKAEQQEYPESPVLGGAERTKRRGQEGIVR